MLPFGSSGCHVGMLGRGCDVIRRCRCAIDPIESFAIVPRHPVFGVGAQVVGVLLQFGEIVDAFTPPRWQV